MPGIVGVLRNDGAPVAIEPILERLCHSARLEATVFPVAPSLGLGSVHRAGRERAMTFHVDDARGLAVIVAGTVLSARTSPRRLDARAIAAEYAEHGFNRFSDLDGGFVIAIADLRKDRLFVVNDRLGQLPLYYAKTEHALAFAPEVKAIFPAIDLPARLSTTGLITFLSCGYCLGATTLFEGVSLLEPGTLLTIEPSSLRIDKSRIWKLRYQTDPALGRRETAEEALHEAVLDAHRLMLADRPSRYDLLLSGGWDSRGMLGALYQVGSRPARALCFGTERGVPRSDSGIAERLAGDLGIPFRFGSYDSSSFLDQAPRWTYLTELANDNFGWCTAGGGACSDLYDPGAAFVLAGDEAWGWNGRAEDEVEARSQVLPATLPEVVRRALPESRGREIEDLYIAEGRSVMGASGDVGWVDRKDFLYVHGRLARFVFPLGWAKARITEVRRPYLANCVLDVIQKIPSDLRLHKNVYRSMLRRYMPRVTRFGRDVVENHPDWAHDLTLEPALRRRMLSLLDADRFTVGPLRELFDRPRFEAIRDAHFATRPPPHPRTAPRTAELKDELIGRLIPYRPLDLSARAVRRLLFGNVKHEMPAFDFLRRMAMIAILIEQLPDLQGRSVTPERHRPEGGSERRSQPSIPG